MAEAELTGQIDLLQRKHLIFISAECVTGERRCNNISSSTRNSVKHHCQFRYHETAASYGNNRM